VRGPIVAIGEYVDHHNKKPKPFIWTAKASAILEKVKRVLLCHLETAMSR
jgi:hypothetical protein